LEATKLAFIKAKEEKILEGGFWRNKKRERLISLSLSLSPLLSLPLSLTVVFKKKKKNPKIF